MPIITSDNPRSEDPQKIMDDIASGTRGGIPSFVDREEAIEYAVNLAAIDDIVLIAGKGHESYQEIGMEKRQFDDRIVATKAVERRLR
jgi:UDP-N-acetylmuramoyl-L-alanyl-D-glutamate--2,6-diaminopimelate ligase